MNDAKLYNGDCLDVMKDIPDNSVDMVLTDPPYKVIMGGDGNSDCLEGSSESDMMCRTGNNCQD